MGVVWPDIEVTLIRQPPLDLRLNRVTPPRVPHVRLRHDVSAAAVVGASERTSVDELGLARLAASQDPHHRLATCEFPEEARLVRGELPCQ